MLTLKQKNAAQMFAVGRVSTDAVCQLFNCEEKDIPLEFYAYAEQFGKEYDERCRQVTEMAEELKNLLG